MTKSSQGKALSSASGAGAAPSSGNPAKRSSARKSVLSKAMRVVDGETRRLVRLRRLAALEADNYLDEVVEGAAEDESEDDRDPRRPTNSAAGGEAEDTKKRKRKGAASSGLSKWASMKVKSLQRVLDEAGCGEDGVSLRQYLQQQQQQREGSANVAANYVTVCAGPSSQPRRKFCSVCGFVGSHSCGRCGSRLCSARCAHSHAETRCLKFSI